MSAVLCFIVKYKKYTQNKGIERNIPSYYVLSPKSFIDKGKNFAGAHRNICAITMLSFSFIGSAV